MNILNGVHHLLCLLVLTVIFTFNTLAWAAPGKGIIANAAKASSLAMQKTGLKKAQSYFRKIPMAFEENRGQAGLHAKYVARGRDYRIYLTSSGARLDFPPRNRHSTQSKRGLEILFLQANKHPDIHGANLLAGKSNYLVGNNPKQWHTGISQYTRVEYKNIYPAIDAVFYGKNGELEFDLILNVGARPQDIRLALDGADKVFLDKSGTVHLTSKEGDILMRKPVIYQQINGHRKQVQGSFRMLKTESKTAELGFELAQYDVSQPLVIDPVVAWSSYLGGAAPIGSLAFDAAMAVAVDNNGDVYVTGLTPSLNFPTVSPFQAVPTGQFDAFVSKISADGTRLLYSTYINGTQSSGGLGSLYSFGSGIKVDANGSAYITGDTNAKNFPVTAGAAQTAFGGGFILAPFLPGTSDAFVAKLNPQGNGLVYATFIGGSDNDYGNQIVLDAAKRAYIVGYTRSNNLPAGSGGTIHAQNASRKDAQQRFFNDVFVAVVDATGATFPFLTYLGGSNDDIGAGITLDSRGRIAITGWTVSSSLINALNPFPVAFPTTGNAYDAFGKVHFVNGLQVVQNADVFVTLINADLPNASFSPALLYSTYFGGSGDDSAGGEWKMAMGIAVDNTDKIYISGRTAKPALTPRPFDFPVTPGAFQSIQKGLEDGFIAKFDPAGNGPSSLIYATLLGGSSNWDPVQDLTVDDQGQVIAVGETMSADFPVFNPLLPSGNLLRGASDAYIVQLNAAGSGLLFSSLIGGTGFDEGIGIAQDRPRGAVIITGHTHAADFPSTAGVFQLTSGGDVDAFITKITGIISPPVAPTFTASLNASVFTTGQTMILAASATAGAPPVRADAYVALQLPDGTLLIMQPGGSFSPVITPLLSNWGVSTLTIPAFFNYTFTGTEPKGTYTWFVGLAQPGTLNFIGNITAVPFVVN